MGAALRIIADALIYRLRRLEMANLAGAIGISLSLRLPAMEVAHRLALGLAVNAIVYLYNDHVDAAADLQAGGRQPAATRFLYEHPAAARAALGLLAAVAAGVGALHSPALLAAGAAGVLIGGGYSRWWKRLPGWDIVSMTAWGAAMGSIGFAPTSMLGWRLAGQLALFSWVFESLQVIRDHDTDAAAGIRTSAVAWGIDHTRRIARAGMVAVAGYGALCLHPMVAACSLAAVLCPVRAEHAEADWRRIKGLYGASWLLACGLVYAGQVGQ